jgi:hypothetical protein
MDTKKHELKIQQKGTKRAKGLTRISRIGTNLPTENGHLEMIGGETGVGDGFLQPRDAQLLHAAIHQNDIADFVVHFLRPTGGIVCGHFQNSVSRRSCVCDVAITGEEQLRHAFIRDHANKITQV